MMETERPRVVTMVRWAARYVPPIVRNSRAQFVFVVMASWIPRKGAMTAIQTKVMSVTQVARCLFAEMASFRRRVKTVTMAILSQRYVNMGSPNVRYAMPIVHFSLGRSDSVVMVFLTERRSVTTATL